MKSLFVKIASLASRAALKIARFFDDIESSLETQEPHKSGIEGFIKRSGPWCHRTDETWRLTVERAQDFLSLVPEGRKVFVIYGGAAETEEFKRLWGTATEMGHALAAIGAWLVCGGCPGWGEELCRAHGEAWDAGKWGERVVVGVRISGRLDFDEANSPACTHFLYAHTFQDRMLLMSLMGRDGVIVGPGGRGTTREEIGEDEDSGATKRERPIVLMPADYWRPLLDLEAAQIAHGTIRADTIGHRLFTDDARNAVAFLDGYEPRRWSREVQQQDFAKVLPLKKRAAG